MATVFQLALALLNECKENPEVANYEVEIVDDTNSKVVAETPQGVALFRGQDDDNKKFQIYTNIREDDYEEALNNPKKFDYFNNLSTVQRLLHTIDECHYFEEQARKELAKQIIQYGSTLYHNIQYTDYETKTVSLQDVRTGAYYTPNMYGVCMHIDDGSYKEI